MVCLYYISIISGLTFCTAWKDETFLFCDTTKQMKVWFWKYLGNEALSLVQYASELLYSDALSTVLLNNALLPDE